MCVLQVGNQNLKPLYFVSLLPSLALLSSVWIVDASAAADRRLRLAGQAFAAAVVIAVIFNVQQTLRSSDRSNTAGELMDRLAQVEALRGASVLTWPAGSHAAQMLGFYLPATRFVRVIDEPRNVFEAREAIRRGVFHFVIVDREAGLARDAPPALESRYRPFLMIPGESDTDGFEVWRLATPLPR
jgi:hypothetical protein